MSNRVIRVLNRLDSLEAGMWKTEERLFTYTFAVTILFILFLIIVGFFLALFNGLSVGDILGGLGIEMVGAMATAAAVIIVERSAELWFSMKHRERFGDPVEAVAADIRALREEIAELKQIIGAPPLQE